MTKLLNFPTTPITDKRLEQLQRAFADAQTEAMADPHNIEKSLEAGRRWKDFIYACADYEGEL